MAKYYIAFDTKDLQPNIKATIVSLGHELVQHTDKTPMAINLIDDPLYPELVAYVLSNHPERFKKKK